MDLLNTILTSTYTMQDLRHRIRILKSYLETKYFGGKFDFTPEDNIWLNSLGHDFYNNFSKENLYQTFQELEKKTANLNPLIIYLSFEPGITQIEAIHNWFRKNISQNILFDIKIDHELIGGAALVYKGIYRDYSLKAKIQENSQAILTEFKKHR